MFCVGGDTTMDTTRDQTTEAKETVNPTESAPGPAGTDERSEFKIEIRKLELPVRPRGVLAE
jgi:hypothetical protein